MNQWLDLYLRLTFVLAAGLLFWKLASHRSAISRVNILRFTLLLALAVPLVAWNAPPLVWEHAMFGHYELQPIHTLVEVQSTPVSPEPANPLYVIYGAIASLLLVPILIGLVVMTRAWILARGVSDATMEEVRTTMATLKVQNALAVRESEQKSPFIFGIFFSKLLLPISFSEWPSTQRQAALFHEATHIKRFDCAWQMLSSLACVVYWCQPLFWILSRALKDESELAADEGAILSGAEATDYAAALVGIARTLKQQGVLVQSQGVNFMNERQLDRRVKSALGARRKGFTSLGLLTASIVAIAGSIAVSTLKPEPKQNLVDVISVGPISATGPDGTVLRAIDTKAINADDVIIVQGINVSTKANSEVIKNDKATTITLAKVGNQAKLAKKGKLLAETKRAKTVVGHQLRPTSVPAIAKSSNGTPLKWIPVQPGLAVSVATVPIAKSGRVAPAIIVRDGEVRPVVSPNVQISQAVDVEFTKTSDPISTKVSGTAIASTQASVTSQDPIVAHTLAPATIQTKAAAITVNGSLATKATTTIPPKQGRAEYRLLLDHVQSDSVWIALPGRKSQNVKMPKLAQGETCVITINEKGEIKVEKVKKAPIK